MQENRSPPVESADEAASPAGLVRRIRDGDREAESELVARYGRGISYLLLRLTGDRPLSDDLLQETLRVVLEKLRGGQVREPEKLAAFIRATARNLCYAESRRRSRFADPEPPGDPRDPAPGPLAQLLRDEDRRLVRRLLGELRSERDREILFRFHLAEESKESICRSLELSSLQFNLVLFRARERFRKLVESATRSPEVGAGVENRDRG